MERRIKKAQQASKSSMKLKKDFKENEKQMHKMRKELIEIREAYRQTSTKLADAQQQL